MLRIHDGQIESDRCACYKLHASLLLNICCLIMWTALSTRQEAVLHNNTCQFHFMTRRREHGVHALGCHWHVAPWHSVEADLINNCRSNVPPI